MGIGMAISAYGVSEQMAATKDQAKYAAKVAEKNAQTAENEAVAAAYQGSAEEENLRAKVRQMQGSQRASFAANGVDLSDGTALDLMGETAAVGETDAQMLRFNAMRQAWGSREQAGQYRDSGAAGIAGAAQRNRGTLITGVGSMASTVGSAYGSAWGSDSQGLFAGSKRGAG